MAIIYTLSCGNYYLFSLAHTKCFGYFCRTNYNYYLSYKQKTTI